MASNIGVFIVIILVSSLVSSEEAVRYDGYRLLRITPQTNGQLSSLEALRTDQEIDFWINPRADGHPVDIFVSPKKITKVEDTLNRSNLQSRVSLENVQTLIDDQMLRSRNLSSNAFDWTDYRKLDEINAWLKEQAKKHNEVATLITAGQSYENRTLTGLRIGHKPNLPIVFVEGGIHAREWISPATATWFIQQALTTNDELIKSYEWHVFPSVNPDGYAFTQVNRFWRKTRSPTGNGCNGVDLNRNWPFQWQLKADPCSETYAGKGPGSEPETRGLITYLKSVAHRTLVYISLHSYSQVLMYPWGYTTELLPNNRRFSEIAEKAVQTLGARFGTTYRHGPESQVLYTVLGGSIDYAYSLNITYPFVFELRDTGQSGFLLPKEQIIPTATETFDALTVILEEVKKK